MEEFDRYFHIETDAGNFIWRFKDPLLYSDDFTTLARLEPSVSRPLPTGKLNVYRFRKVDGLGQLIKPPVEFSFELSFNHENRLTSWLFSPIFMQIAPPEFLEASIRSLAGAKINEAAHQLKATISEQDKIDADFPKKAAVLKRMGEPLGIDDEGDLEIYSYHFMLETPKIDKGYESRALTVVKLTFNKSTQELVKMAGRFAGLKLSIDYRKFAKDGKHAV